jgi:hypothetical protein
MGPDMSGRLFFCGARPELVLEIGGPTALSCLPADTHQCSFAQQVGIALAVAGNFDELASDGPFDVLVAVSDPQSETNKFEGNTEDTPGLGVEVLVGKEWDEQLSAPFGQAGARLVSQLPTPVGASRCR